MEIDQNGGRKALESPNPANKPTQPVTISDDVVSRSKAPRRPGSANGQRGKHLKAK
jgi:hypothetical protein